MSYFSITEKIILEKISFALSITPNNERIAIAFSGGLDSSVLLDAANKIDDSKRYIALHINHNLNYNSKHWKNHSLNFAKSRSIDFFYKNININCNSKIGIEAEARKIRYKTLHKLCIKNNINNLWIGQHADDQIETFFLRILRGSGLTGMRSILFKHKYKSSIILHVRPLLFITKKQLHHYANFNNIQWIEDDSNIDIKYKRNVLRNKIIPKIEKYFPYFRKTFIRAIKHINSSRSLINTLAKIDLKYVKKSENILSKKKILKLKKERAINLLNYWLYKNELQTKSKSHLNEILKQLNQIKNKNFFKVKYNKKILRCYNDNIYFDKYKIIKKSKKYFKINLNINWKKNISLFLTKWSCKFSFFKTNKYNVNCIPLHIINNNIIIARLRIGGESMKNKILGKNKKLKKIFQEKNIPSWKRNIPFLFIKNKLLFAPFIGINYDILSNNNENNSKYIYIKWSNL